MSKQKRRSWTAAENLRIVLAGRLRGKWREPELSPFQGAKALGVGDFPRVS